LFFGFLIALLALAPVIISFNVLSVAMPNPTVQSVSEFFQDLLFLFYFISWFTARGDNACRAGKDGATTQ
jgi:hypothetical protein